MRQILLVFSLLLLSPVFLLGQVLDPGQVQNELEARDIDQVELERRLRLRGIDVNNIDPTNPAEVAKVEQAIKKIVEEIDSERQNRGAQEKDNEGMIQKDEPRVVEPEIPVVVQEKVKEPVELPVKKAKNANIEDVQKAVEDGATLEEALAEQASKEREKKLPTAKTWGQQIFRDKSISIYRQSEDVKPPNSYILGVGDYITISIWGYSQDNIVFEINSEGYIKPDRMPRVYLKGVTLGKAKVLLQKRFREFYRFRPEEFEVTLNFARTITVNVVGEVFNYGSFTIPALNTAFNALVAAGGPTDIGSVRNIKLYRAGKETKNIDVYKFLLNPATQEELFLEENDFIHVPIAERVVTIEGAVHRPNRYELIGNENLIELIEYAGGLKDEALRGNIQIRRIKNDKEVIVDANLTELKERNTNFELFPSDIVTINTINKGVENYIDVTGAVEFPGQYSFSDGMRITEVLKRAVLREEARKDVAFLQRSNIDGSVEYVKVELGEIIRNPSSPKNLGLRAKDKLIIYSLEKFTDKRTIKIEGNVRTPGVFPYDTDDTLRIIDLILLGDGLNPNAAQYGYIKRFDITNKEVKDYLKVDLFKAIEFPNSEENILIQPFDEVSVLQKESYTDEDRVSVIGAVRNPKKFDFTEGMRISDLVYVSDGLKPDATEFGYLKRKDPSKEKLVEYDRIELKKAVSDPGSPEDLFLKPGDELITYSKETFTDGVSVTVSGSVRTPGTYQFDESLRVKDILTMAGGLKIEAAKNKIDIFRIEFNENKPTKTIATTLEVNDEFEIMNNSGFKLHPYDQIVVRQVPDFEFQKNVTVEGEVYYPGNYAILNEDEPLSSLIKRAGGITEFAFPEGAKLKRTEDDLGFVIIELDEVLKSKKSKSNILLKDGDILIVPKTRDLVTINGLIKAKDLYPEDVLNGGNIHVPYDGGKRAYYYVRKHGGGIGKDGDRTEISVEYPNGEVKRAKDYFLFSISPKVRPGSRITVGAREIEKEEEGISEAENKVDWEEVFSKTVTQVTSLLTLILLVQRLD